MRIVSFKKLATEEGKLERSIKQEGKEAAPQQLVFWS